MSTRRRVWVPEAPLINLRKYQEVSVIRTGVEIEGYFDVELVHARTGLVKRRLRFRNIVTNAGLDFICGADNTVNQSVEHINRYVAVGTGSTPPTVNDTQLEAEIARTNNNGGFSDQITFEGAGDLRLYNGLRRTRVFTEGEANGNLTELGMFNAAAGGVMWNRQLFRDELGNPTTIVKTPEDQLRITYEYRVYPPFDDEIYEVNVNGTPTQVTMRAMRVATTSGWGYATTNGGQVNYLGFVFGGTGSRAHTQTALLSRSASSDPTGSVSATSAVRHDYVAGTFYREREDIFSPAVANQVNSWIGVGSHSSTAIFQLLLNPGITKTNTERLVLLHRFSVARRGEA